MITAELEGIAQLQVRLEQLRRRYSMGGTIEAGFMGGEPARVARVNEFGDPTNKLSGNPAPIPPRPFMTYAAQHRSKWVSAMASELKAGKTVKEALTRAAQEMRQSIITSIRNTGAYIRNAPYTIAKKGSDRPLIATGKVLIPNVRYTVTMRR